jgi:hypothetical protein
MKIFVAIAETEANDSYCFTFKEHPKKEDIIDRVCDCEGDLVKLTINDGDWVTLSLTYAKLHGENNLKKFKILSKTVKASQLYNDGYIAEFGYNK